MLQGDCIERQPDHIVVAVTLSEEGRGLIQWTISRCQPGDVIYVLHVIVPPTDGTRYTSTLDSLPSHVGVVVCTPLRLTLQVLDRPCNLRAPPSLGGSSSRAKRLSASHFRSAFTSRVRFPCPPSPPPPRRNSPGARPPRLEEMREDQRRKLEIFSALLWGFEALCDEKKVAASVRVVHGASEEQAVADEARLLGATRVVVHKDGMGRRFSPRALEQRLPPACMVLFVGGGRLALAKRGKGGVGAAEGKSAGNRAAAGDATPNGHRPLYIPLMRLFGSSKDRDGYRDEGGAAKCGAGAASFAGVSAVRGSAVAATLAQQLGWEHEAEAAEEEEERKARDQVRRGRDVARQGEGRRGEGQQSAQSELNARLMRLQQQQQQQQMIEQSRGGLRGREGKVSFYVGQGQQEEAMVRADIASGAPAATTAGRAAHAESVECVDWANRCDVETASSSSSSSDDSSERGDANNADGVDDAIQGTVHHCSFPSMDASSIGASDVRYRAPGIQGTDASDAAQPVLESFCSDISATSAATSSSAFSSRSGASSHWTDIPSSGSLSTPTCHVSQQSHPSNKTNSNSSGSIRKSTRGAMGGEEGALGGEAWGGAGLGRSSSGGGGGVAAHAFMASPSPGVRRSNSFTQGARHAAAGAVAARVAAGAAAGAAAAGSGQEEHGVVGVGAAGVWEGPWRKLRWREVEQATDGFATRNLVGTSGGYSRVYQGRLPGGQQIAVRREMLTSPSAADAGGAGGVIAGYGARQGGSPRGSVPLAAERGLSSEVAAELAVLATLSHRHVAQLVGVCAERRDEVALVLEHMEGGTLDTALRGDSGNSRSANPGPLAWSVRPMVARQLALALHYLHEGAPRAVVHRNVRAASVMLTRGDQVKLSEFGLALFAAPNDAPMQVPLAGTFGYLAPEYLSHGAASTRTDVFAFGVVLLELLTGQPPVDDSRPRGLQCLVQWARPLIEAGRLHEVADPALQDRYHPHQFALLARTALLCTHKDPSQRPSMLQVLHLLDSCPPSSTTSVAQPSAPLHAHTPLHARSILA
ncbi:unnamed protein product [Closterium sp. Yama58-4]|nr:unnamed protein product [Closterium sp. Yama58-4]